MLDRFRAWRRRRKDRRDARRAVPTPTLRELAREVPMAVFLVSGLLIAAESGFVGLVAGFIVNKNWQIDLSSPYAYLWFVGVAVLAVVKKAMDGFIDTTFQHESDDERFKRLIREVLDERRPGSQAQPEPSD